ncbi:MAG: hypothetical protein RLZZ361_278 [Cyanobacteriota bacterium]|jgi:hypothetical protein
MFADMMASFNTLNNLALVGSGFCDDEIARIQEYLEALNPSARLIFVEPGFGRQNFLSALKNLILADKPITEKDIINIEFQPDLIIKVGSDQNSLDDSFVVGASYAEIAFCSLAPQDFSLEALKPFLEDFENRKRNFGV